MVNHNQSEMQYKNIQKTARLACACISWLEHWMKINGSRVTPVCSVYKCTNKSVVGGHVQACDDENSAWLIMPLCSVHNTSHFVECFDVKVTAKRKLVSANAAETCKEIK